MRIIGGKHRGTKLFTLDGLNTRPTLDRIKEPLFSILQFDLQDANVLDLFSGSGALGLEALSRGAKKAYLCDNSNEAFHIIEKNVEKTNEKSNTEIIKNDYLSTLKKMQECSEMFDIVFLDPPYMKDYAVTACAKIVEYNLLKKDGIIVIETDNEEKISESIKKISNLQIYDRRKYGRVHLLFLKRNDI